MLKIIMLRHYMTQGNLEKRYIGTTDEPILPVAEKSSQCDLTEILRKDKFLNPEAVFISPMLRCRQTANIIFRNQDVTVIPDYRECDFGDFENKNFQELKENPKYLAWMESNGRLPFPNGESREDFLNRSNTAFEMMIKTSTECDYGKIAMIVHGGTIMSILDQYSCPHKDFYDWQISNGEGFRMEWNPCRGLQNICLLH